VKVNLRSACSVMLSRYPTVFEILTLNRHINTAEQRAII